MAHHDRALRHKAATKVYQEAGKSPEEIRLLLTSPVQQENRPDNGPATPPRAAAAAALAPVNNTPPRAPQGAPVRPPQAAIPVGAARPALVALIPIVLPPRAAAVAAAVAAPPVVVARAPVAAAHGAPAPLAADRGVLQRPAIPIVPAHGAVPVPEDPLQDPLEADQGFACIIM
jgi:hypothetical protein